MSNPVNATIKQNPKPNEWEARFICCLIDNRGKAGEIYEEIRPEDFANKYLRNLYIAILKGEKDSIDEAVDSAVEAQVISYDMIKLGREQKLKLEVKKMKEAMTRRRLEKLVGEIYHGVLDKPSEITIEQLQNRVLKLSGWTKEKKNRGISAVLDRADLEIVEFQKRGGGFRTGFKKLDNITKGVMPGRIWCIGALSGIGKSYFTLQMVNSLILDGAKVVFFSTENSDTSNIMRLIGCNTGISDIKIFTNELTTQEKERIEKMREGLRIYPLWIYDDIYTIEEIAVQIKLHKLRKEVDIVVIDYIQQLNKGKSIYERMSEVALQIQEIATKDKVAFILVSQLSVSESRQSRAITYKGAGEIRDISDIGFFLTKPHPNVLEVKWEKFRYGVPQDLQFDFFSADCLVNKCYIKESV